VPASGRPTRPPVQERADLLKQRLDGMPDERLARVNVDCRKHPNLGICQPGAGLELMNPVGVVARPAVGLVSRLLTWLFGKAVAEATGAFVRASVEALPAGKNAGVYVVRSAAELETLFGRLTAGGEVIQGATYPGTLVKLKDATTVGMRAASKSGGAAIDINLGANELLKVHVQ
jgi:hypothetical protein